MITPVDIQQKKFHIGLGYDKKDVNTFFDIVSDSYEKLYRSNAELTEKVNRLTDELQNYKSKEADLQRSLLIAEKNSEDTKSKAYREAKSIELEAKSKAKNIVGDAEDKLVAMQDELELLKTQYAAYKSNFCMLMKKQLEFLKETDFDFGSYIDERALGALFGATQVISGGAMPAGGGEFGSFDGDPQMRDESSLGGANQYGYAGGKTMDINSTSAVYTSMLGANDNFVDPFSQKEKPEGRYNPYDGTPPKAKAGNNTTNLKMADKQKSQKRTNSSAPKSGTKPETA